jgi:D-arabinose 1-dehydrogenase-like Zn-dependent alcohol dehydrogenase
MSQTAGLFRPQFERQARSRRVEIMRVFVAGGTGVLVPQLVAHGHQVTATTTSAAKLDALAKLGAQGVLMDGLDAASATSTGPVADAWALRNQAR